VRLLTRPWFVAVLVSALVVAWALTIAPWAPLHDRTVSEVRLDLRAPSDRPHSARSGVFSVPDADMRVSLKVLPPEGASGLPAGFMGSARWVLERAGKVLAAPADWSGSADLSGASPAPVHATLEPAYDAPRDGLRLRVTGATSSPATIVVRLTRSRDTVAGLPVPLVLVLACVVLIGIPATTASARQGRPVIFPPTHEHY